MYKFFLTLRYLRTRFVAYFSMVAVALSVAMVLIVVSVLTGFINEIEKNVRQVDGDLVIGPGGLTTFPYYDEFIAEARAALPDDIAAMTPVISSLSLLKILDELGREKDRTVVVEVLGLRFEEFAEVTSFRDSLFYEAYFPGTTSFENTDMPTWWVDEQARARLPNAFEDALAHYCTTAPEDPFCEPALRSGAIGSPTWPGLFASARSFQEHDGHRGTQRPGVVLGIEQVVWRQGDDVERLFPRGTEVNLRMLVPSRTGNASPDSGRTLTVRYVDDSHTRVFKIDDKIVYCDFDWLQHMLDLEPKERVDGTGLAPPRASRIHVKLAAGVDPDVIRGPLREIWDGIVTRYADDMTDSDRAGMERVLLETWYERHSDIVAPVRNERTLAMGVFGLISLVAILVVVCVFYMIAQDKSREIGIIKSMGATSRGVGCVFVVYAMGMGLAGSIVGVIGGACFVWKINELQDWLASYNPNLRVWSRDVYSFDHIPNTVDSGHVLIIVAVALVASVLGSLAAARRAANVWPVNALRYE